MAKESKLIMCIKDFEEGNGYTFRLTFAFGQALYLGRYGFSLSLYANLF